MPAGSARSRVVVAVFTVPAALSWPGPVRVIVLLCCCCCGRPGAGQRPWPKRHVVTRCGGACCSWALVWSRSVNAWAEAGLTGCASLVGGALRALHGGAPALSGLAPPRGLCVRACVVCVLQLFWVLRKVFLGCSSPLPSRMRARPLPHPQQSCQWPRHGCEPVLACLLCLHAAVCWQGTVSCSQLYGSTYVTSRSGGSAGWEAASVHMSASWTCVVGGVPVSLAVLQQQECVRTTWCH